MDIQDSHKIAWKSIDIKWRGGFPGRHPGQCLHYHCRPTSPCLGNVNKVKAFGDYRYEWVSTLTKLSSSRSLLQKNLVITTLLNRIQNNVWLWIYMWPPPDIGFSASKHKSSNANRTGHPVHVPRGFDMGNNNKWFVPVELPAYTCLPPCHSWRLLIIYCVKYMFNSVE